MLLMNNTGRPRSSVAYGIIDPNGNPGNFRECVDKLPILPSETSVRARSASEGSGTTGPAGPGPACCRVDTVLYYRTKQSSRQPKSVPPTRGSWRPEVPPPAATYPPHATHYRNPRTSGTYAP